MGGICVVHKGAVGWGGGGEPKGKKEFGKARHRWEYHVERDLKKVERAWNGFI